MSAIKEIVDCEVCGKTNLLSVLDLGLHPLCDDLVELKSSRKCNEYPIEILFCNNCITAHQRYQVPKKLLFSKSYHYRARMTKSVLNGMQNLVGSIESRYGNLSGKVVLDIGCNDGSLLNFFKEKGATTIGIEPTDAALDSPHDTINGFFDSVSALEVLNRVSSPDIITFTNVFAHIEDLNKLLINLKSLVGKNTLLVIENHYLGDVLKHSQFDTFYHEHPRTYSKRSFDFIADKLDLNLVDFEFVSRYGGNIRAYMGLNKLDNKNTMSVNEEDFTHQFSLLKNHMNSWKIEAKNKVLALNKKYGKIKAKAFPGRAAILIKLLGLNENNISAVYEIKGSIKVDHYVPGTRIPILPEKLLYEETNINEPILNLAWHLAVEVRKNLKLNGYLGDVYDIKDSRLAE